jgi:hypothetical protein
VASAAILDLFHPDAANIGMRKRFDRDIVDNNDMLHDFWLSALLNAMGRVSGRFRAGITTSSWMIL